jgi:hypothetical protein
MPYGYTCLAFALVLAYGQIDALKAIRLSFDDIPGYSIPIACSLPCYPLHYPIYIPCLSLLFLSIYYILYILVLFIACPFDYDLDRLTVLVRLLMALLLTYLIY